MNGKEKLALFQDVDAAWMAADSLLGFVDDLNALGIATIARIGGADSFIGLRFERDGASMAGSDAGIYHLGFGPRAYSATRHAPVFRAMEAVRAAGGPQPTLLDETGEVVLDCGEATSPEIYSGTLLTPLFRMAEDIAGGAPFPALGSRAMMPGYDAFSRMSEEELRESIKQPISDDIEALPDNQRVTALRWVRRMEPFLPESAQPFALARQKAWMAQAENEPAAPAP